MVLFILESIGTSELILIAVVALIVFGPRKLPQMAKTIGKTMAEFRSATNDFKATWEKEVAFAEEEEKNTVSRNLNTENYVSRVVEENPTIREISASTQFSPPLIKELSAEDINEKFHSENVTNQNAPKVETVAENKTSEKRDWL